MKFEKCYYQVEKLEQSEALRTEAEEKAEERPIALSKNFLKVIETC